MSTYARIVDGFALDCQVASDIAELATRFNPDWLATHTFSMVPDGTVHGAYDNGDGTFTNPSAPPDPDPVQPQPTISDLQQQIAALTNAVAIAVPAAAAALQQNQIKGS